jgi:predicted ATPase
MGKYFSLGHVGDLISHNSEGDDFQIKIDNCDFSADLQSLKMEDYTLLLKKTNNTHPLFHNSFHYLSAFRLPPQNSYDVHYDNSKINFGIYGEFAIAELSRLGNKPAINKKLANTIWEYNNPEQKIPENTNINLSIALKESMKNISPGFDINLTHYENFDKVANTFNSNGTAKSVRPVNTGFGISYVLPIIIAALCTEVGGTLIVENPEVHLHPAAQSKLAMFLATASTCDIQVIIETHSDHIINGVRVFCKENAIEEGHTVVNSISTNQSNDTRNIRKITIDTNGDLSDVEPGFFDQSEKDLMRLF